MTRMLYLDAGSAQEALEPSSKDFAPDERDHKARRSVLCPLTRGVVLGKA
jgi:hypothetical protein